MLRGLRAWKAALCAEDRPVGCAVRRVKLSVKSPMILEGQEKVEEVS